jgi:hypothetical protein
MWDMVARYAKAAAALLGAMATALTAALEDGTISGQDWIAIVLAGITALGVAGIRNRPAIVRVKPSVHDTIE